VNSLIDLISCKLILYVLKQLEITIQKQQQERNTQGDIVIDRSIGLDIDQLISTISQCQSYDDYQIIINKTKAETYEIQQQSLQILQTTQDTYSQKLQDIYETINYDLIDFINNLDNISTISQIISNARNQENIDENNNQQIVPNIKNVPHIESKQPKQGQLSSRKKQQPYKFHIITRGKNTFPIISFGIYGFICGTLIYFY
jgi:ASC-1-like (ASCH) protein